MHLYTGKNMQAIAITGKQPDIESCRSRMLAAETVKKKYALGQIKKNIFDEE